MGSKIRTSRFPEAEMRAADGTTQARFWGRYGVSQSGGCRYEQIRRLPRPLAMLMWLHRQRRLSDGDLADALAATKGSGKKRRTNAGDDDR